MNICANKVTGADSEDDLNPAEVFHGERLFLETRFAHYFYRFVQQGGEINVSLTQGQPILNKTVRFFGLPPYQIPFVDGPFKGKSINCRTCHLVDEHVSQKELGMRAYSDFASRSPLPLREDNVTVTVRNSPALVDIDVFREDFVLHLDGEFASLYDVIKSTLTGRNLGWLPDEQKIANKHICKVIREDNGLGELADEFDNLSYAEIFSGKRNSGKTVSHGYLISRQNRINVDSSSCDEILDKVSVLIEAYIRDLRFAQDENNLSPYDVFLRENGLPEKPEEYESFHHYSSRLINLIRKLKNTNKLIFITRNPNTDDGRFRFHDQAFKFTEQELIGMEIFFTQDSDNKKQAGNCVSCHPAPTFTDFKLHNIGVSQIEYEAVHGIGSFHQLNIPSFKERKANSHFYLPATVAHPNRKGLFRAVVSESDPMLVDLGAWNIVLNDDFPSVQETLHKIICDVQEKCNSIDQILDYSIATFKTPSLRDLGHSAPYMHNGQISYLHAVVGFYISVSNNHRVGHIRNGDKELNNIRIGPSDIQPLVQFLIALYEDYH